MGGVYYVLNLAKAISFLNKEDRPKLFLFYSGKPSQTVKTLMDEIDATQVNMTDVGLLEKVSVRAKGLSSDYNLIQHQCQKHRIDFLYPLLSFHPSHSMTDTKVGHWIPDFQHLFLGHLFDDSEKKKRNDNYRNIADQAEFLFLSSENARSHFLQFYSDNNVTTKLLRFKSLIGKDDLATDSKFSEFETDASYFMVCNQFWTHKNHLLVLQAINELKKNGLRFKVRFTGKFYDPRDPDYSTMLEDYIRTHQLGDFCEFLGFIDRDVQLRLMRESLAIIQPSRFEGWSTVIEDAKALGKFVLASSLEVNKEQMGTHASYFDVDDEQTLAQHMSSVIEQRPNEGPIQGDEERMDYAQALLNCFESCM